jgi:hypothetical protein
METSSLLSVLDDPHSPERSGYYTLSLPSNDENHNALETGTFDDSLLREDPFKFLAEEEISILRGDIQVPSEPELRESRSQSLQHSSLAITIDAASISETGCQQTQYNRVEDMDGLAARIQDKLSELPPTMKFSFTTSKGSVELGCSELGQFVEALHNQGELTGLLFDYFLAKVPREEESPFNDNRVV